MNQDLKNSQYRLRKTIGILGILLPVILLFFTNIFLNSLSHYYYTPASIFFIGIFSVFGLVLISYKGYDPDKTKNEKLSDDLITTVAGFSILVAVMIPTTCYDSGMQLSFCEDGYLFGHKDKIKGTIHLISAGIFLVLLGWMCIKQFTKSTNEDKKTKNSIYRICGSIVWACVGLLIVVFLIEKILHIDLNDTIRGYTFILESIAAWAFGIAWLIKGKIDEDWSETKVYVKQKVNTIFRKSQ
jgi:hypothetical protein